MEELVRATHPHFPHGFTAKPLTRTKFQLSTVPPGRFVKWAFFFFRAKSDSAVLRQPFLILCLSTEGISLVEKSFSKNETLTEYSCHGHIKTNV